MLLRIGGGGQVAGGLLYGPALSVRHRTTVLLAGVAATTAAVAPVEGPYASTACWSCTPDGQRGAGPSAWPWQVTAAAAPPSHDARDGVVISGRTTPTSIAL